MLEKKKAGCREKDGREGELTAFGRFYVRFADRWLPVYAAIPIISCFVWNVIVYYLTGKLMAGAKHYDLTTAFDRMVPFIPQWVFIYLGCFLFWAVNYILSGREGRESCCRFVAADLLSRTICAVFLILLPTTNVRPDITGNTLADNLMRFVYGIDEPVNLFPSIHCLVSWMSFLGIRKSRKVPAWYKVFSCVFAILVMASTQFTKQHYIVDVISGVAVAQLCMALSCRRDLYRRIEKPFRWIERKVFGVYRDE